MKKIICTILVFIFTLCLFGCKEKTYTFDEVIGFNRDEITEIKYFDNSLKDIIEFKTELSYTIEKLDVKYKKDSKYRFIDSKDILYRFSILSDKNLGASFYWLKDKTIYFVDNRRGYYSIEPIESLITLNQDNTTIKFEFEAELLFQPLYISSWLSGFNGEFIDNNLYLEDIMVGNLGELKSLDKIDFYEYNRYAFDVEELKLLYELQTINEGYILSPLEDDNTLYVIVQLNYKYYMYNALYNKENENYIVNQCYYLHNHTKLSFSNTSISEYMPINSQLILDIFDDLYWKSSIDSYDDIKDNTISHILSAMRTVEEGINNTIWKKGYETTISYFINYETGFVYMSPEILSTNIHDLYSFLTEEQLEEVKRLISIDVKIYTLNDVLGFDKNEVISIYSLYSPSLVSSKIYSINLDVQDTMKTLDVKYHKVDVVEFDALNNKPVFTIDTNNEIISLRWLNNNKVCIVKDNAYYISNIKINLTECIYSSPLHAINIMEYDIVKNIYTDYNEKYNGSLSTTTPVMGIYDNALVMFIGGDTQVVQTISVLDYDFTYHTGFDILVYKDNMFYSFSNPRELNELLEQKILKKEDIVSLFNKFNCYYKITNNEYNTIVDELTNVIKNSTPQEFREYFKNYDVIKYCGYSFLTYKKNICVAVEFSNDDQTIKDFHIFKKIIVSDDLVDEIKIGMNIMEVISIIGNPIGSFTSGVSSLDFVTINKQVRLFFDNNMNVYDIDVKEINYVS